MKRIYIVLISMLALSLFIGCGKADVYGETITDNSPEVTIKQIMQTPEEFEKKTVILQGEIKEVCPSGCWFFIDDEDTELYVNIGPSGFAIPQKSGSKVRVEGELITHNGSFMLMGKGVEIK